MHHVRQIPWIVTIVCAVLLLAVALWTGSPWAWAGAALTGIGSAVGLHDWLQPKHAILRNYPLVGHLRYIFEGVRPEIRQYFIEDDLDGRPFNRERRSLVYQRAKGEKDYDPFGSELDMREVGYEWIGHSMAARTAPEHAPRVRVGGPRCTSPYYMSLLNVSAMSYGSLGPNAVLAMGRGAREAGFAHNTGEGGISRYHLETGADLVWQIGTGYFGCRAADGGFDADAFKERASHANVKAIELKLSQGAKPGHGGILPAHKVTGEIAAARGIPEGESCLSPPSHRAFETPRGLVDFVDRLRDLSGGKPVGIKLCVGLPVEFMAIAKAMIESGSGPDFIVVDGGEGGTGAAPPEFGDHVGMPLEEGLVLVRNVVRGAGLEDRVSIGASGKVVSAMDLARCLALGAEFTNAARAFMMSVGCIQSQLCHTNHCPVGVATLDPSRNRGLDVEDKSKRVARFHESTIHSLLELTGAAGLESPLDFTPHRIRRRVSSDRVRTLAEIHDFAPQGSLLTGGGPHALQRDWDRASENSFRPERTLSSGDPR